MSTSTEGDVSEMNNDLDYIDVRSLIDNGSSFAVTLPKSELRSAVDGNLDEAVVKVKIKENRVMVVVVNV